MSSDTFSFESGFQRLGRMPRFGQEDIAREPPLRHVTVDRARQVGGPIVRAFLEAIPPELRDRTNTVVRAAPTFLRQGWGSVGWHLDSVNGEDWSQRRPGFWRVCCQMGGLAATRVAVGTARFPGYPDGAPHARWHDHVQRQIARGTLRDEATDEAELFLLGPGSIHTTAIAEREGFRIFLDCNTTEGWAVGATESIYAEVSNHFAPSTPAEAALMAPYHFPIRT